MCLLIFCFSEYHFFFYSQSQLVLTMASVQGSLLKISEPIECLEERLTSQPHNCFHLLNTEINESFIQTIILTTVSESSPTCGQLQKMLYLQPLYLNSYQIITTQEKVREGQGIVRRTEGKDDVIHFHKQKQNYLSMEQCQSSI